VIQEQSVSHLSRSFSFRVSRQELRRDFRNRRSVATGGGGGGGRRGRLGSRGHVFIEVSVLIVHLLFQLAPPCVGTGVLHLRVLRLKHANKQRREEREERREDTRGEERREERK